MVAHLVWEELTIYWFISTVNIKTSVSRCDTPRNVNKCISFLNKTIHLEMSINTYRFWTKQYPSTRCSFRSLPFWKFPRSIPGPLPFKVEFFWSASGEQTVFCPFFSPHLLYLVKKVVEIILIHYFPLWSYETNFLPAYTKLCSNVNRGTWLIVCNRRKAPPPHPVFPPPMERIGVTPDDKEL